MVQVKMVDRDAIEFACGVIGGWHYCQKSALRSGRPFYTLQLSDKKAEAAIRLLLPYLRVKRKQAEVVLRLRELQRDSVKHRTKVVGYRNFPNAHGTVRVVATKALSDEYVAECESLYLLTKRLNAVGVKAMQ